LGVEAVKQVEEQNQGTALGTYSAFLDLALGLTGPLAGWVAGYYDLATLYLLAAIVVVFAFLLILRVHLQQRATDVARPGSRIAAGCRHRQKTNRQLTTIRLPCQHPPQRLATDARTVAENNRDRATIQPAAVVQSESLTHTVNS
jgi:hypothetical protein